MIKMKSDFKAKIFNTCHRRVSEQLNEYYIITSSGTAYMLLKNEAKLRKRKAVPSKYQVRLEILLKKEENEK